MKFYKRILFTFYFLIFSLFLFSQKNEFIKDFDDAKRGENGLRVMFYNLENFFDTRNDSISQGDDEFSYGGIRYWSNEKYKRKLNNIYKVIVAAGGWEPPEIIGVCEIENKWVVSELIYGTPLRNFKYRFIHYDSPDPRGIDVALIYRSEKFKPLFHQPINIKYSFDTSAKTRDILYVKGLITTNDTLHLFVNHFPSKYGGASITIEKRNFVAKILKSKIDSILISDKKANILVMGDFNDEPGDESIRNFLNSKCDTLDLEEFSLLNLMCNCLKQQGIGTNKFKEKWSVIDQILVSKSLTENNGWHIKNLSATIYAPDFLLIPDETYLGVKTFRTYNGFKYSGGFSDHLPVFIDLIYK
jgi:predicted extracellular nuclease